MTDAEPACRSCGCTQSRACPGGCYWVDRDLHDTQGGPLCSRCAARAVVDSNLIARTARKRWRCYAFDSPNETPSPDCVREIEVGTRYTEYLGATYAFQAGHRYCGPCAVQIWHVAPGDRARHG